MNAATVDAVLKERFDPRTMVGISIAVMHEGKIELAQGYGSASLARQAPVEPETRFAIGSVTKQFTCAIVLLLAEQRKLALHDTVAKYYPHLTRAEEITLLDLMNHVSGYRDYYPLDFVVRSMMQPIDPDDLIEMQCSASLDFDPGTRASYSNTNYILLSRIAEKVTGQPFGELLKSFIFAPLGMSRTTYEPQRRGKQYAQGYTDFVFSDPEPAIREGTGWIGGAGGMFSTPTDLAKWDLALMTGKVLQPDSYHIMTAPRKLTNGGISTYGCGLAIASEKGTTVLQHNGAVSGFVAMNRMVPATRSALISCVNRSNGYDMKVNELVFPELLPDNPARPDAAEAKAKTPHPPAAVQNIPDIPGDSAEEAGRKFFLALRKGSLKGVPLGEEFRYYLNRKRVAGAAARLQALGELTEVRAMPPMERGGMAVCRVEFTVGERKMGGLMYRSPEGKIEQLLLR
jgi:CubicO group peptidase (beta-lactamase class C family)